MEPPDLSKLQPEPVQSFWKAVIGQDAKSIKQLLKNNTGLIRERIAGEWTQPWQRAAEGDVKSNTCLHWCASRNGSRTFAECLILHGADVDAMGYEEGQGFCTPLILAAECGNWEMLGLLLEHHADPNIPGTLQNALFAAAEREDPKGVQLLLAHGAVHDVFTAAIAGRADLVEQQILAVPRLINARSLKNDRTPYEEACLHSRREVIAALEKLSQSTATSNFSNGH